MVVERHLPQSSQCVRGTVPSRQAPGGTHPLGPQLLFSIGDPTQLMDCQYSGSEGKAPEDQQSCLRNRTLLPARQQSGSHLRAGVLGRPPQEKVWQLPDSPSRRLQLQRQISGHPSRATPAGPMSEARLAANHPPQQCVSRSRQLTRLHLLVNELERHSDTPSSVALTLLRPHPHLHKYHHPTNRQGHPYKVHQRRPHSQRLPRKRG